jgi:hypothetical protein
MTTSRRPSHQQPGIACFPTKLRRRGGSTRGWRDRVAKMRRLVGSDSCLKKKKQANTKTQHIQTQLNPTHTTQPQPQHKQTTHNTTQTQQHSNNTTNKHNNHNNTHINNKHTHNTQNPPDQKQQKITTTNKQHTDAQTQIIPSGGFLGRPGGIYAQTQIIFFRRLFRAPRRYI